MARKKKAPEHANHERWLISYADFITLLFAFFVVMFASSQTDKTKAAQVSDAVKDALEHGGIPAIVHTILGGTVDEKGTGNAEMKGPGGEKKRTPAPAAKVPDTKVSITDLMPSMAYLSKALAEEMKANKIEVHLDSKGLVISLRQAAFFSSGGDEIDTAGFKSLEKIAKTIGELPNPVRLEGHTDSIPIHNEKFRSNWELSTARSIAMLQLLTEKYGLPNDRFSVAGYADTKPIESNNTPEGRTHNRRVDIIILNQSVVVGEVKSSPIPQKAGR